MIAVALTIVSICCRTVELWTGAIVTLGEDTIVKRSEYPGLYWYWMAIQSAPVIGIPALWVLIN